MSNIIKFAVLLVGALLIAMIVRIVVASSSKPAEVKITAEKVLVSAAELPQGLPYCAMQTSRGSPFPLPICRPTPSCRARRAHPT